MRTPAPLFSMAPPLKVETLPLVLSLAFPKVAKPSTRNKPVLVLRIAPPPWLACVVLLEANVAVPFNVVVPVPAVAMAPPPPVELLLVNVLAPVMLRMLALSL